MSTAGVLMHFQTGRLRFTGNAGALARPEREARNDDLPAVLSCLERLCACEAVRARAPAFPVIRSDCRNCISTTVGSGLILVYSNTTCLKHAMVAPRTIFRSLYLRSLRNIWSGGLYTFH